MMKEILSLVVLIIIINLIFFPENSVKYITKMKAEYSKLLENPKCENF